MTPLNPSSIVTTHKIWSLCAIRHSFEMRLLWSKKVASEISQEEFDLAFTKEMQKFTESASLINERKYDEFEKWLFKNTSKETLDLIAAAIFASS